MTQYLSFKLKILSFFLMIMVVLLHASLIDYSVGINRNLQIFMTESITRVAVPLFFVISGFLFFIDKKVNIEFFRKQYVKRAKTLLIPYCIWCGIGYVYLFFYTGTFVVCDGLWFNPPQPVYQLWFLRDLVVCVILSPLIYLMLKYLDIFALLLFFMLIRYYYIIEGSSIFDFALGGYLALHKFSCLTDEKLNLRRTLCFGIIWGVGCFVQCFFDRLDILYVKHFIILLGICFIWNLYDVLYEKYLLKIKNSWILSTSFFIYLFHEPLLTVIKKTALYFQPNPFWGTFFVYIGSFVLTIPICILVAYLLNKYVPTLYGLLTGGRTIK